MATHVFDLAAVESPRYSEGILSSNLKMALCEASDLRCSLYSQVGKAAEQTFQAIYPLIPPSGVWSHFK